MIRQLVLLVSAMIIFSLAARAQDMVDEKKSPKRAITVTGTAQRMTPPDVGLVVLAVETQDKSVGRAVSANNTASNRVMDAINKLKFEKLTIRTLGFDVEPIYEQPPMDEPVTRLMRIIAYRVTNRIEVRIPEPGDKQLSAEIGQVLDAGLNAGANRVDSVSFALENDLPVQQDVLGQATKNAHETATVMATAAGVKLGRLMNLSSTPFYPPPMPMFSRAAVAEGGMGVPITAGLLTIQATVTAVYEIE